MRKHVEESVATGAAAGGRGGRFSAGRKREVVMRLLRGWTDGDCASSKPPAYSGGHPGSGRRCGEHSPKRDHARRRVTNDQTATPRATLRHGLASTSRQVGLGSQMLR